MNNKITVLWGVIVVGLVLSICIIGFTKREELLLSSKFDKQVKEAVNAYIKEENSSLPLRINSDELVEKEYLEELKDGSKTCSANILVKKVLVFKSYDINYICETSE